MDIILFCGGLWGHWSFFWLLDVMQQPSWEVLLDEAVKEVRNHERGTTRKIGAPCLSAQIKGKAGLGTQVRHRTRQWVSDAIFNTTMCFSGNFAGRATREKKHCKSCWLMDQPYSTWKTCSGSSVNKLWTYAVNNKPSAESAVSTSRGMKPNSLYYSSKWLVSGFLNARNTLWPNEHLNWGLVSQVR